MDPILQNMLKKVIMHGINMIELNRNYLNEKKITKKTIIIIINYQLCLTKLQFKEKIIDY